MIAKKDALSLIAEQLELVEGQKTAFIEYFASAPETALKYSAGMFRTAARGGVAHTLRKILEQDDPQPVARTIEYLQRMLRLKAGSIATPLDTVTREYMRRCELEAYVFWYDQFTTRQ